MPAGTRPVLRAGAGVVGLVAAAVGLRAAAAGGLGSPPLTTPGALIAWVDAREPAVVALALVRGGAELTVWYLTGLCLLHVVGAVGRLPRAVALADALSLPGTGRLVRAGLGLGMLAASSLPGTTVLVDAAATPAARVRSTEADTGPPDGTATLRPDPTGTGTATMRPAPGPPTDATTSEPAPEPVTVPEPPPAPTTWTVVTGESFWTIARDLVEQRRGTRVTATEIDPYWRTLVAANRHRLVDPADPDLLLPGQVLEAPELPSPVTG